MGKSWQEHRDQARARRRARMKTLDSPEKAGRLEGEEGGESPSSARSHQLESRSDSDVSLSRHERRDTPGSRTVARRVQCTHCGKWQRLVVSLDVGLQDL